MTDRSTPAGPGLLRELWELLVDGTSRSRVPVWFAAAVWLLAGGFMWTYFTANAVTDLLLAPLVANRLGGGAAGQLTTGQITRLAVGFGLIAVMVLVFTRVVGGISWAALGMQRRDGRKLIVGGAAGVAVLYVAAMVVVAMLDNVLATAGVQTRIYPGSRTPGAQLLVSDIVSSTFSGAIWEELILLAIPLALFTALVPVNTLTRVGQVAAWAAVVAVLVAMRCAIHLYYGWIGVATVAIWAAAAIALFELAGTVWPLIIAHALYDAAAFLDTRVPAAEPVITALFWIIATAGTVLLVLTLSQLRSRLRTARHRAVTLEAK